MRKGKLLKIVPETPVSKLGRLRKRKSFKRDPDGIIRMDWLAGWSTRLFTCTKAIPRG